jgi:DnaJ-class molecular chaperone
MIYTNDPFATLGIAENASIEIAKSAYRKLAMEHHPDRGGNETAFKNIKAAWEKIEAGYVKPKVDTKKYKSTFGSDSPKQTAQPFRADTSGTAGGNAPGYEAQNKPPKMPRTTTVNNKLYVTLEMTDKQAFEGCTIPFIHQRSILEYIVRPGTMQMTHPIVRQELFLLDAMIGSPGHNRPVTIFVTLNIISQNKKETVPTSNIEVTVKLCALALFTGGKLSVKDALGKKVSISLLPGYNPLTPIIIEGGGYGSDKRGNIIITIEPIFKAPSQLTAAELKQLQKLNEMTK